MHRVLTVVMVSLNHEGVLELVRDRPAFAADLLGDLLDVKVPPFRDARRVGGPSAVDILELAGVEPGRRSWWFDP